MRKGELFVWFFPVILLLLVIGALFFLGPPSFRSSSMSGEAVAPAGTADQGGL